MLGNERLYFPIIKHIGDVIIGHDDEGEERSCYTLDWSLQEQKLRDSHQKWVEEFHSNEAHKFPFIETLPEKYDELVKSTLFAIDNDYMKEIRRNAVRASEEWGLDRPFDTVIRDQCLKASEAHVWISFMLLSDCMYDPETKSLANHKSVIQHAMVYKLWVHQTGNGLIWGKAKMDDLGLPDEEVMDAIPDFMKQDWEEEAEGFGDFLKAMEQHFRSLIDANNAIGLSPI